MPPRRLLSANLRRMPQTRERLLRSVCSYHFSILWPPIGPNAPMIRAAAPAHLALDRRQAPGPSSTISMRRFFARPSGVSFEPRVRRTYPRFRRQLRSASWPFRIDANGRPRPDLSKSTRPDRTVRGGYSTSGAAHATRPQRARLQRLRGDVQIRERHQTPVLLKKPFRRYTLAEAVRAVLQLVFLSDACTIEPLQRSGPSTLTSASL